MNKLTRHDAELEQWRDRCLAAEKRLASIEAAADELVRAHGPTPVPAWVRLRVDKLAEALRQGTATESGGER